MRLVCPKCASQYEVDASLFPAEGREVQCSNCEETWTQYPEEERAPVRLEPAMAAPAPARPSERLPESERAELARAVTAERAVRDGAGTTTVPHSDSDEDEDIVAALREHIAAEGTDFDGGPAQRAPRPAQCRPQCRHRGRGRARGGAGEAAAVERLGPRQHAERRAPQAPRQAGRAGPGAARAGG